MLEEDFFRFVPAKDETYDQIVLIAPQQESKHPRHFSGIIKTGDKCVHHSKLNPKQRRKIDNISKEIEDDGYMLPETADRILWSDETFNVLQLTNKSLEETSTVIKVASNSTKFSCVDLSLGQNLLLHTSGIERRISAYDLTTSKQLEIPNDFACHVLWKGRHLKVKEVLDEAKHPVRVKVTECKSQLDDFTGHVLLLKGEVLARFIVCSLVYEGWVDQSSLLVIPEAIGATFRVGKCLRGGGEKEWVDFLGMLKRSVRHKRDQVITGFTEIIVQDVNNDEISSSLSESRTQLPCYENVEINLASFPQLQIDEQIRHSTPLHEDNNKRDQTNTPANHRPNISTSSDATHQSSASRSDESPFHPVSVVHGTLLPVVKPVIAESKPHQESKKETSQAFNNASPEERKSRYLKVNPPPDAAAKIKKITSQAPKQPIPQKRMKGFIPAPISAHSSEQFTFPDKLEGLSSSEVKMCLQNLGFENYGSSGFEIDGRTLSNMSAKELEANLGMTPFEANKISRFIRGWRP